MLDRLWRATICAALVTAAGVAPAVASQENPVPAGYVVSTEDVPCPPVQVRDRAHARVRTKRIHKVAVRRRPPVKHKILAHHVVRRRPAHMARASDPAATKRCTVVRTDPLTVASFGYLPEIALLQPVSYELRTADPTVSSVFITPEGTPAIGRPPGGATGGPGTMAVSAAPEPEAWVLMVCGVAAAGAALRRRRSSSHAGVAAGS